MLRRTILIILSGTFLLSGCAYKSHTREYRREKIRLNHPQWDDETLRKVASREVEIGMNQDMVVAAMGSPDSVSRSGNEEKWGYAILIVEGTVPAYKKFVYFVYFKNGTVTKTTGDRSQIQYLHWYK